MGARLIAGALPVWRVASWATAPAVFALSACVDGAATAPPPAPAEATDVTYVRAVRFGDATDADAGPLTVSGVVTSDALARPSSKTGGVLSAVLVKPGDDVRRGQVIARVDATELAAGVAEAEAGLAKARRDLARLEVLVRDSVATRTQRDDAATAVEIAERRLERLRFDRAQSVIRSPLSGRVLGEVANAGETVGPGQPVAAIQGTAPADWRVRVGLTDAQWAGTELGQAAEIRFDAFPGERYAGRLTERAVAVDPASRTFPVEFALRERPPSLAAGLVARVSLASPPDAAALTVPVAALGRVVGKRAEVFLVDAGRARAREIQLGRLRGGAAEVLDGLRVGDSLITTGVAWLRDGDRVAVVGGG